jgi:hypothetical protein
MSENWKPGDHVIGLLDGNEIVGIVRGGGKRMFYADSVTTDQVDLKHVRNLRRLVVIDAEDREQVERLLSSLWGHATTGCDYIPVMQAALREFANPTPPKPDEPTGLGAVVEDRHGLLWTRVESGEAITRNPWYPAGDPDVQPDEYERIKAVRILSPGVTA